MKEQKERRKNKMRKGGNSKEMKEQCENGTVEKRENENKKRRNEKNGEKEKVKEEKSKMEK